THKRLHTNAVAAEVAATTAGCASGTPGSASTESCASCCTPAGARRRGRRSRRRSRCGARSGARGGSTDVRSFEEWLAYQQFSPNSPAELDALKRAYDAMCANAEADKTETIKGRFCDWATQYYVVGRMAARAGFLPVYGNLLHHAVEMYVKAALIGVVSLENLKRKYIH